MDLPRRDREEDRNSDQLRDQFANFEGLSFVFAKQSKSSPIAAKVAQNMRNAAMEAENEYSHSLSSALDLNSLDRHRRAVKVKEIEKKFCKHQVMSNAVRVMAGMTTQAIAQINDIHGFAQKAFKSMEQEKAAPTPQTATNSHDAAVPRDEQFYLMIQMGKMIEEAELKNQVDRVNVLTELRKEFMKDLQMEKVNQLDPSYTPKYTSMQMNI